MKPWLLRASLETVSQQGKLADAICYPLARSEGVIRFVNGGRIEIKSNAFEQSIRLIALTGKNAVFAGSDGGAEQWVAIASLVENCKLKGVDAQACLAETIARIGRGYPQSKRGELLPWPYTTQVV